MNWRLLTILSLVSATVLGVWLFSSAQTEPVAFHILFLILVVSALFGLLHGIRSRIEMWLQDEESSREAVQTMPSESERTDTRSASPRGERDLSKLD